MRKIAVVVDKFTPNETERFGPDSPSPYHTDYRIFSRLLPECVYVHAAYQALHGWPDLEEINDCDMIVYHTGPWTMRMSGEHARETMYAALARYRKPLFVSFEAGDYEQYMLKGYDLIHGLNRALEQPHVVGLMLQVPYHYRALRRMVSRTIFLPPPTVLHRHVEKIGVYKGEKSGLLLPRTMVGCLGGTEYFPRNGHLSAMVASDVGDRHGHRLQSYIGDTELSYSEEHGTGTLTESEVAAEFGVRNYECRGTVDWPDWIDACARSKVMVNLDTTGSWGRVTLESVLMGTAALCSNQLFPSICLPETNVDPFDLRRAGNILERLVTDDAFYEEVVDVGRRRIIKLCDVDNVADRMIRYVRKAGL